jgi:DNA-binding transcriptional LysR family regulator
MPSRWNVNNKGASVTAAGGKLAKKIGRTDLDLRQLRYLRCIVQSTSFTRAAKVLGIAQPALSLHVQKLEQELGTPLLIRHSRGVRPTRAGEILLQRAEWIIDELDRTKRLIRSFCAAENADAIIFDSAASPRIPTIRETLAG